MEDGARAVHSMPGSLGHLPADGGEASEGRLFHGHPGPRHGRPVTCCDRSQIVVAGRREDTPQCAPGSVGGLRLLCSGALGTWEGG